MESDQLVAEVRLIPGGFDFVRRRICVDKIIEMSAMPEASTNASLFSIGSSPRSQVRSDGTLNSQRKFASLSRCHVAGGPCFNAVKQGIRNICAAAC